MMEGNKLIRLQQTVVVLTVLNMVILSSKVDLYKRNYADLIAFIRNAVCLVVSRYHLFH
jgi:hypothetical protein